MPYSLAVLGGGPAGASAAITAARLGIDVVLIEAGKFPRHKVCGEFISAEALDLLAGLLSSTALIHEAPRIRESRVFVDGRKLALSVDPPAASVSRHRLDFALWEAAGKAGVTRLERARALWVKREDDFVIGLGDREVHAQAVIDATGRWSNLHPQPINRDGARWIGCKAHFLESNPASSCDLYFFEGGYCGVQRINDISVNVSAMVRADVARDLAGVLAQSAELRERSGGWSPATVPVSTAHLNFHPPRTSLDGILLCGDAAAFLDPFAGDGISMALHTGRLAACAVAEFLSGSCPLDVAINSYAQSHRELIQPALRSAARLRRLIAMPRALRAGALSLLDIPIVGSWAVRKTRVRVAV
ncbi:MAG TPA: FAD-dependent monooxygenase [Terriglobales bacterium]|nr:FAD-dependent monooxygenase [Terriglobales bacterium]